MEEYKLLIVICYFIGYAFSIGAFIKLWNANYDELIFLIWIWFVCLLWPIVWLFYLPYKLSSWIFK